MSDSQNSEVYKTIDHLFRQETGKTVSVGGSTSIEAFTLVNNNQILQGFGLASYFDKPDLMQEAYQYLFSQSCNRETKSARKTDLCSGRCGRSPQANEKQKNNWKIALIP